MSHSKYGKEIISRIEKSDSILLDVDSYIEDERYNLAVDLSKDGLDEILHAARWMEATTEGLPNREKVYEPQQVLSLLLKIHNYIDRLGYCFFLNDQYLEAKAFTEESKLIRERIETVQNCLETDLTKWLEDQRIFYFARKVSFPCREGSEETAYDELDVESAWKLDSISNLRKEINSIYRLNIFSWLNIDGLQDENIFATVASSLVFIGLVLLIFL